ncbi:MAG: DUF4340 domain-containing protein [Christensenellales bacterium]|jgi:hypothetical protein
MNEENRRAEEGELDNDIKSDIKDDVKNETESGDPVYRLASSKDLRGDKEIKKTNRGKVLLIALIICALGVGIFFLAQALMPGPEEPTEIVDNKRPVTLSQRVKDDVSRVELSHDGKTTVYIMDAEGQIYVESDPDFPLNQTSAGSILYVFAALTTEDTVEDNSSRKAEFGFEPPLATAKVSYTDGEEGTYYLGSKSPTANTWYFMAEGRDEIFLVWANVGNYMTSDYTTMRKSSSLTMPDVESPALLVVENSSGVIEIKPYEEGARSPGLANWHLSKPYTVDADTEYLSTFISSMGSIAIKSYIGPADDLSQYGLSPEDKPARLYLEDTDGAALELLIGSKYSSSDYFAWSPQIPGDVFTIAASYAQQVLDAKAFTFSSIFASLVNIVDLKGLDVEINGKTFNMVTDRELQYDEEGKVKLLSNGETDYLYSYYINGVAQDEKAFRTMYQAIIGVTVEGALPLDQDGKLNREGLSEGAEYCKITFRYLDEQNWEDFVVSYVPYKSLYYAVKTTISEDYYFFMSKEKVANILTAIDGMEK